MILFIFPLNLLNHICRQSLNPVAVFLSRSITTVPHKDQKPYSTPQDPLDPYGAIAYSQCVGDFWFRNTSGDSPLSQQLTPKRKQNARRNCRLDLLVSLRVQQNNGATANKLSVSLKILRHFGLLRWKNVEIIGQESTIVARRTNAKQRRDSVARAFVWHVCVELWTIAKRERVDGVVVGLIYGVICVWNLVNT